MDDSRFDDFIKNKLDGFDEVPFDPAAIASLHHGMAAVTTVPWYAFYRSELVTVTSAVVLGILLIFLKSQLVDYFENQFSTNKQIRQDQENELLTLRTQLLAISNQLPDTVIRYEENPQTNQRIKHLSDRLIALESLPIETKAIRQSMYIGTKSEIPSALLQIIKESGMGYFLNDDVYLIDRITVQQPVSKNINDLRFESIFFELNPNSSSVANSNEKSNAKYLDAKGRKALEKHYYRGIGVEVGVSLDYNYMVFEYGSSIPILYPGLAINLSVSPNWQVETGLKFGTRHQGLISNQDLERVTRFHEVSDYGTLVKMEIDNHFIELPVVFRRDWPVTSGLNITSGAGLVSYLFYKEEVEYSYRSTDFPSNEPSIAIKADRVERTPKAYLGGIDVQVGASLLLKNSNKVITSVYFQKGIGKMGREQTNGNLVGLKTMYVFSHK